PSAHPIDRIAGDRARQSSKQCRRTSNGEALVAGLGGRGDRNIVDAVWRQLRMASQQLAYAIDDEVISPGLGIHRAGLAEGGTHAVDKDDFSRFASHVEILLISNYCASSKCEGASAL